MSRRNRTNLERAFDACKLLTADEMQLLEAYLNGWRAGKGLPPSQATLPLRKRSPKKPEAASA